MEEYPFKSLVTKAMPEEHNFMAWKLIYDVYHTEEKWIPPNQFGLATDSYDKSVLCRVGVYTQIDWEFPKEEIRKAGGKIEVLPKEFIPAGSLIAHQRIIRWPSIFMFVEEYEDIGIGLKVEQGRHVGEASRMVIHRRFRTVGLSNDEGLVSGGVAILVYAKQKELCEFHGIKIIYTATTSAQMRLLRNRGLPLEKIKKQKIIDAATGKSVSIEVDVMKLEEFHPVIKAA